MSASRRAAHVAIRGYQLTLSGLSGRQCRYLPTCSAYTDEAIQTHGVWAGSWMGLARNCPLPSLERCGLRPAAEGGAEGRVLGDALAVWALAL